MDKDSGEETQNFAPVWKVVKSKRKEFAPGGEQIPSFKNKLIYSERKEFACSGGILFPFRVDTKENDLLPPLGTTQLAFYVNLHRAVIGPSG